MTPEELDNEVFGFDLSNEETEESTYNEDLEDDPS